MSNALPEIWTLVFFDRAGTRLAISGKRELLQIACEEWEHAKTACDGTGDKVVRVEGFTDSADRAEMTLRVVVEDTTAVVLNRMT